MKPTGLKLDGKPLVFSTISPLAEKIKKFLDSQPADELFRADALGAALKSTTESVRTAFCRFGGDLAPYTGYLMRPVRTKVFGNPKAIVELRRGQDAQ